MLEDNRDMIVGKTKQFPRYRLHVEDILCD